jgi:hypothetical protein
MSNQFIVDNYIGGDYARWSKTYSWMIRYLSSWYKSILGYGNLARFVDQFPCFHDAIKRYVRTEKAREQEDGTFHLIPGLRYCPWYIFAFIDCSIEGYPSSSQDLVEIMRVLHGGMSMLMLSKHSIQSIVSIMDSK